MIMKIAEKLIRDVMTRGVTTVSPDTPIKEITEKMANQHLSGVAVIGVHGDMLGFISEMDILKVLHKPDLKQLTAEDIMSSRQRRWRVTATGRDTDYKRYRARGCESRVISPACSLITRSAAG
jgi:CBS domain-containing protein